MPGMVTESFKGPGDSTPDVPGWCYPKGARMCPCGHHEGYHDDAGTCLLHHNCGCKDLPAECFTPEENM